MLHSLIKLLFLKMPNYRHLGELQLHRHQDFELGLIWSCGINKVLLAKPSAFATLLLLWRILIRNIQYSSEKEQVRRKGCTQAWGSPCHCRAGRGLSPLQAGSPSQVGKQMHVWGGGTWLYCVDSFPFLGWGVWPFFLGHFFFSVHPGWKKHANITSQISTHVKNVCLAVISEKTGSRMKDDTYVAENRHERLFSWPSVRRNLVPQCSLYWRI